jgi:hypothetical protein
MVKDDFNQEDILYRLIAKCPEFPPAVVREAQDIILQNIHDCLVRGRPVTLRSFGRLIPRRYNPTGFKKLGLILRPSPKIIARLNTQKSNKPKYYP